MIESSQRQSLEYSVFEWVVIGNILHPPAKNRNKNQTGIIGQCYQRPKLEASLVMLN